MRKLARVLLLAALGLPCSPADAQTTQYRVPDRQYSTSVVLSILGKKDTPVPGPTEFNFGEVNAGISTSVSCGRLRGSIDLNSMAGQVTQIPGQLMTMGKNLMGALPLLVACQASPTICAEIKNINYQLNEELKVLTDVCQSMDTAIDKAAREGRARGWKKCVNEKGGSVANAQQQCNEVDNYSPLYTDLAKGWLNDAVVDAPQRILGSLLEAVGQKVAGDDKDEKYQFLAGLLGELKIDGEGKVLGAKPEGAKQIDVKVLAAKVGNFAVTLACDVDGLEQAGPGPATAPRTSPMTSSASDPATRYWQGKAYEVVHRSVDASTIKNLRDLTAADRGSACNALGRALARETLGNLSSEIDSTMGKGLQNPGLATSEATAEIRALYRERSASAAGALRDQRFDGSQKSVGELLPVINTMASISRDENGRAAAAMTRGKDRMKQKSTFGCDSSDTCE